MRMDHTDDKGCLKLSRITTQKPYHTVRNWKGGIELTTQIVLTIRRQFHLYGV
jgi:hypothetical protein